MKSIKTYITEESLFLTNEFLNTETKDEKYKLAYELGWTWDYSKNMFFKLESTFKKDNDK